MTETIDSAAQRLSLAQIILYAVHRAYEAGELPQGATVPAAVASITAETSMPNTDVKQIGNTVFVSHFNQDKSEASMRAFNMDSARNFFTNSLRYTTLLADSGVKRMTVDFKGDAVKQMILMIAKTPVAMNYWGVQLFKTSNGGYRAYVNLKRVT